MRLAGSVFSQKRHPAELDNVDQLIYDMCGRRRLQVSAWLRPADAAALLLDGQKVLAYCTPRTPSAAHYGEGIRASVCFCLLYTSPSPRDS